MRSMLGSTREIGKNYPSFVLSIFNRALSLAFIDSIPILLFIGTKCHLIFPNIEITECYQQASGANVTKTRVLKNLKVVTTKVNVILMLVSRYKSVIIETR